MPHSQNCNKGIKGKYTINKRDSVFWEEWPSVEKKMTFKVHDNRTQKSFEIRLKSTEYRELENRVRGNTQVFSKMLSS